MPKTLKKTKGNRFDKVRYHIPYYTTPFFNPNRELEEGEVETSHRSTVKLPVKISAAGNDSCSNATTFEIKGISHFDNNVEKVLNNLMQLKERVIKPKGVKDPNEEIKLELKYLALICNNGPASQTLQEANKVAHAHVYEEHIREYNDAVEEDIFTNEESVFYSYLNKKQYGSWRIQVLKGIYYFFIKNSISCSGITLTQ